MNDQEMKEVKVAFKNSFPEYDFLWRYEMESHGDIDVDAFLLEVFGVPAKKKSEFVRSARALRRESEKKIGRKIILVSHTPEAVEKHYGFVKSCGNASGTRDK